METVPKKPKRKLIKVNCLHAECPNCGNKVDIKPAKGTYIKKP